MALVLVAGLLAGAPPAGAFFKSAATVPLAEAEQRAEALMAKAEAAGREPACDLADRICALGVAGFAKSAAMAVATAVCPLAATDEGQACEVRRTALRQRYDTRVDAVLAALHTDLSLRAAMARQDLPPTGASVDLLWHQGRSDLEASTCGADVPACIEGQLWLIWDMDQLVRTVATCAGMTVDQATACRRDWLARMRAVDGFDRGWIKRLIAHAGWPTEAEWGHRASQGAWVVVQHSAVADPDFQNEMLPVIKAAVDAGRCDPAQYAYLADRIAVTAHRTQLYGTQGTCTQDRDWQMDPVSDPDHLDERRAQFGLPPEAEYQALSRRLCGGGEP
ncbi:DUF6624 domain-containing protein [Nitrospirillum iridis]|uniref:Uncharacterized protein n=1 Tax=Nitrospirillum iridis TaxID=765888 RepID=A0A7X0AY19_9PROT|nr:DUF6624 domain-containing protein [Nitrospirillum iridis]MBB6252158.1 hypothetical protein [Nitrospirillum iridis]